MSKIILIADDDPRIRYLISHYLKFEGFNIIEAEDGRDALNKFKMGNIDLIILDVMMPHVDGLDVCKAIRNYNSNVIILMLTAKSEEMDKLLGYELGADDYVTKPFSLKVLVAKVKALLRRVEIQPCESSTHIKFDGIEINELSHEVSVNGENINLSVKEFDLLNFLIRNKGIALSRDTILNNVWGYDYYGDFRIVDNYIRRLRERLGEKSGAIATVVGMGYKFEVKK